MGYTLSITTGYGVELDEAAAGRMEEEWNQLHPEDLFENDPYWSMERLLKDFPEVEVDSYGFMGDGITYVLWVKKTLETEYGVGVFEQRPGEISGYEADALKVLISKYGIQGKPGLLTGVNYG